MSNVAHSTLTGSNLHENKGVASATDNTVATASSAATVWQKLTASHLTGTGNAFGGNLLHVRQEFTTGVHSADSLTAGTWVTRVLNTVKTNEISSATLASNQISLPAGTYFIDASANIQQTGNSNRGMSKLYNVTGAADLVTGSTVRSTSNNTGSINDGVIHTTVRGRFTLAGTSLVELRSYSTSTSNGGQAASIAATDETYIDVLIWKVG